MAEFAYRAASAAGEMREGVVDAQSREHALRQIKALGLTPLLIEQGAGAAANAAARARGRARGEVNRADVLAFTSELSVMLKAGLSLDRALRVLIDMSHKPAVAALVNELLESVKGGASLSKALSSHRELFGDFYLNLIRSGEAGGQLSEALARLVEHMERMRALRESVVSATIYPAILLVVAALSLVAMLGFVVPQFETLFKDIGDALPLPTQIVIELGRAFRGYGLLIAAATVAVVLLLRHWLRTREGSVWLQSRLLALPVLGRIVLKYDMTRFARTLGTLITSGVPILTALGIARETIGNLVVRDALANLAPAVKNGRRVADAVAETGLFEPIAINLIRVGEETGRLDTMMLELARIFDRDVETAIKRGLTMIEPVLILVLGLVIASIIVSILMGILAVNDLAV